MNYIGREPAPAGVILVGDTNPVGAIAFFHGVPDGSWVRLNGQVLLKASYPDLWAYAQGFLTADQVANPGLYKDVAAGTFAVPNLDGLFIRGAGGNAAALGVKQADDFKSHNHPGSVTTNSYQSVGAGGPAYGSSAVGEQGLNGVSVAAQGGTETRPQNVAFIPCVKALRTVLMPATTVPARSVELFADKSASNSPSLDFTDLTGFASVRFVFDHLFPATAGQSFGMQCSTDNGASYPGTMFAAYSGYNASGSAVVGSGGPVSLGVITHQCANSDAAIGVCGELAGVMGSATKKAQFNFQTNFHATVGVAYASVSGMLAYNAAGTVNALRFMFGSGNITSGRILAYGLRA